MLLAERLDRIEPFYVMEVAKAAQRIAAGPLCDPAQGGRPMIYLNIGEPDFGAAPRVREAAQRCVQEGRTGYTQATGLPALREAISRWYRQHHGLEVPAQRIIVTAGASAALQLVCLATLQAGDEVLMPDPCYPCNRHFVAAADARAVLLETTAEHRFQLDADAVDAAWGPATRGVLLASPSNPTGTSIEPAELQRIVQRVHQRGGLTIVDEIYQALSFDEHFGHSVLATAGEALDSVISVNSFSKYFGMTGWRLGWLVVPDALVDPIERLAQFAALECFHPESIAEFERRRVELARRRDFIVPALGKLGLPVPVMPDGAFYAWADCNAHSNSSWDFCFDMMQRAQVALTPGKDFGPAAAQRYLRLSFASSMAHLEDAVHRLQGAL